MASLFIISGQVPIFLLQIAAFSVAWGWKLMTALIGAKESATMTLSNRTIALLSQPFEGGDGPSHSVVELIWESAGAFEYLGEGNKLERVLGGLRSLQAGRRATKDSPALPLTKISCAR